MENSKKIFDGLLVLEYQKGNNKALAMLVKKYNKDFYRYALWFTKDSEMSQDIVQDAWTVITRKMWSLKNPNSFKSWALQIVIRKSKDHLNALIRRRKLNKNYKPLVDNELVFEDQKSEQLVQLRNAFRQLTFDQQMVIRLFYLEEYSLKEIGKILDIAEGTVKSRLYHAREKLKSIINRNHEKRERKNR